MVLNWMYESYKGIELYDWILYLFHIFLSLISGQDSCTGDSGGPLVFRDYTDDPWYQVGVVSFGYGQTCGSEYPGVYTKVSGYLDWIEKHLEAWFFHYLLYLYILLLLKELNLRKLEYTPICSLWILGIMPSQHWLGIISKNKV